MLRAAASQSSMSSKTGLTATVAPRARARRLDVGARVRIIAQPHYTHLEDPAFARPLKAIRRLGARLFTVTVA